MIAKRYATVLCLIVLMCTACTAVANPTPTPENSLADVMTVPVLRPSATPTSPPATATATEVLEMETAVAPIKTLSSKPPAPTMPPTPLPAVNWTDDSNWGEGDGRVATPLIPEIKY